MNTGTNSNKWSWIQLNERRATRTAMLLLLLLLILPVLGAQGAVVFTTLHSFGVFTNGAYPSAALVQGSDGYFYGTAGGGTNGGNGTVFKISTNGALTTLYSFTGGKDGGNPQAALVQGSDGNFYGTTQQGGTNNVGTVFRISTNGAFTSLYSFTGGRDGANPVAALVQGSDGNFYGTTGGFDYGPDYGTVFRISTNGALTSLYSFTGGNDGMRPNGLVQGSDGNFYGTAGGGTDGGFGTVFKISTNGALTNLYSFTGGNDGALPRAGLVQGNDGNLYGTTVRGGTNGWGTVFKISASGAYTSLYVFSGNDGAYPAAALVQGSDGNFYGTTAGTWDNSRFGYGTVFRISTNGALTSLYSFSGTNDGGNPVAGLVQGSDGNYYGTTENGGTPGVTWVGEGGEWGYGTVFKISPNGALTSLYSFPRSNDGWGPSGLVQASDGNFYGTTEQGGTTNVLNYNYPLGAGTVFKISTNGALTSLYSFTGGNDGADPRAGLVQGSDGNFYGTTYWGGTNGGFGTVFKISPTGALTSLYSFIYIGNDGCCPSGALVLGRDGYFYGTTEAGGTKDAGTVFRISTNGVLTNLYSFTGPTAGGHPQSLVQGSDGNFYGTTEAGGMKDAGTVFRISTNGVLTNLYSFTGSNEGAAPYGGLVQGSDGNFYGTTAGNWGVGGTSYGTVFKITTNGVLTSLYSFPPPNDGWDPSGLVEGSDGYFYGTTESGGTNGWGTVFKISADGAYTSLYSFTGGNDGAAPYGGLVQGSDGSFYGTTAGYGAVRGGTIFRLTIVPEPQLTIIPSGPYVILAWPTTYNEFSYAGYTLQSTTNLGSSAVWTTNSSPPVVIGGENVVINTISGRQQFYRLSQ